MSYDAAILISLKRRTDRREKTIKHLEERGIKNLLIYDAFDAQELKNVLVSPPKRKYFSWAVMGSAVVCCALSHIGAMKMGLSLGYTKILMMEDDVVLSPDFNERFELTEKQLPEDWEHLFLGGAIRKDFRPRKIIQIGKNVITSTFTDCTHCYCVRNEGIEKVCNEMLHFNTTLDDAINDLIYSDRIKSYTQIPLSAYQGISFSDIDNKFMERNDTKAFYSETI